MTNDIYKAWDKWRKKRDVRFGLIHTLEQPVRRKKRKAPPRPNELREQNLGTEGKGY